MAAAWTSRGKARAFEYHSPAMRHDPAIRRPVLGALALLAALAAGPAASTENLDKERESVLRADADFAAALAAHDRERFRSFFHADAIFLGATVSRGADAIVAAWAPFFDPEGDLQLAWRPQEAGVAASGEFAYTIGDAEMVFRGGSERRPGKYLTIWRRDAEGAWKIVADGTLVVYPDGDEVRDLRRAFSGFWRPFRALGGEVKVARKPETVVEAAAGDLAFTLGRYSIEVRDGDRTETGSGGYLTLWKKTREMNDLWPRWVVTAEAFSPPR